MNATTSKRLLSLLLALITALSLCVPVFATGGTGNGGGTTGETTTSVSTIVDDTLSSTLAQEKAALTSPDFGSEWGILGLARSGYLKRAASISTITIPALPLMRARQQRTRRSWAPRRVRFIW